MFGSRLKYAFMVLAVFALIGYSGCILSPDEEVPQKPPVANYKSLTDKENIIYNLIQCYKERDKPHYEELLNDAYEWHNQDESINDRAKDIEQTNRLFDMANSSPNVPPLWWLDKLELTIAQPGTWQQIDTLGTVSCDDCWETTRDYYIVARINGGATTYIGNAKATFIAIGVPEGGKRIYRLRHIYDIPNL
ncbi:MAG: hypothetical protein WC674_04465 [Candidatus Krumholzibacteriia bacterium]